MADGLSLGDGPGRLFARFRAIIICAFLGLLVVALALVAASVRVKEGQDRRMLTELLRAHAFLLDSQAFAFRQAAATLAERIGDRLDDLPARDVSGLDHACGRQARGARFAAAGAVVAADESGVVKIMETAAAAGVADAEPEGDALRSAVAAAALTRGEVEALAPNLASLTVFSREGDPLLRLGRADDGRDEPPLDCATGAAGPLWIATPSPRAVEGDVSCDDGQGVGGLRYLAPVQSDAGHAARLALDLEPCAIRRMNADLAIEGGKAFLVADGGVLFGAPFLPASVVRLDDAATSGGADSGLDDATLRAARDAFARPAGDLVALDDRLVFVQPLTHAPWALVVSISAAELTREAIFSTSARLGVLLALIAATLAVAVGLTRREFIAPAQALVADIVARGAGLRPPEFAAPVGWRPYFEKIRDVFAENEEAAALRQELTIAARMQASILPTVFPGADADLGVWGFARPAREVGGDFFDIFEIGDGKLGVVIADVSGKGVPAALFMVLTRTLTRAAANEGASPAAAVAKVNRLLSADNPETMFVTMFYGVVDPVAGRMTYVNAGHNAPYRLRPGEAPVPVETACGPALGVFEDAEFGEAAIEIEPGDSLVLYTDGVTEAMDVGDQEYGEDRLEARLAGLAGLEPDALASALTEDVDAFAGEAPQADDITVLTVKLRRTPPLTARIRSTAEIGVFSDRFAAWGEALGAAEEDLHALTLSMDELISNTFEHGGEVEGRSPTVEVSIRARDGALIATLEDDGKPFDPFTAAAPDLDAPAEERSVGGLGVHFVKTLTDAHTYVRHDGRNLIMLTKRLTKKEAT